jgi:glycosyltransferase involved in cell wall biosynthesis
MPVARDADGRNRPLVSVVIPTYKRADLARAAVLSALQQDIPPEQYEVIVVDSSPDEEVLSAVRQLQEGARCVLRCAAKPPEGPGPSRNLGARLAEGEFIAFMDSDCRATAGWLHAGVAAFEPDVGIVQGRTLADPDGSPGILTWYVVIEREGFVYECANIFYRRAAFEQAGGFTRDLHPRADHPMGGEDVDLAWRVKRNGWQSRFASAALVHHAVLPIPVSRWIVTKQLYIWPLLVKKFPEVRRFFFARYFYDQAQACLLLAILGALVGLRMPLGFVLCVPYAIVRGSEHSRTLRGPLRPLRVAAYLVKDLASLALLAAGSLRFRSLLL